MTTFALEGELQACTSNIARLIEKLREDFGPSVPIRWIRSIDVVRRYRIRRAARARKARRGWR